jgi:general secretion pathway protein N
MSGISAISGKARLWGLAGALVGGLVALVAWAPAAWLASAVADASGQRLLLADARGTVWRGSAVPVLTGGVGSRDASALPGRLHWSLGLQGTALALRAQHDCCINGELLLRITPGWGRLRIELPATSGAVGQWPASWLVGLGTPWNTLQPSGSLQLFSSGLMAESVQGRWRFGGRAELALNAMGSRLSTLDVLGSYRLVLSGAPLTAANATAGDSGATLQLATTSGALLLDGSGQWVASKLRFNGQASAAPGSEAILNNLLNIIGRRQGARSVISIG